jgi:hypothetical protein
MFPLGKGVVNILRVTDIGGGGVRLLRTHAKVNDVIVWENDNNVLKFFEAIQGIGSIVGHRWLKKH